MCSIQWNSLWKIKVYYLIPRKYSTVDQSFWSKVDSDAALLPSWYKLVLSGSGTAPPPRFLARPTNPCAIKTRWWRCVLYIETKYTIFRIRQCSFNQWNRLSSLRNLIETRNHWIEQVGTNHSLADIWNIGCHRCFRCSSRLLRPIQFPPKIHSQITLDHSISEYPSEINNLGI